MFILYFVQSLYLLCNFSIKCMHFWILAYQFFHLCYPFNELMCSKTGVQASSYLKVKKSTTSLVSHLLLQSFDLPFTCWKRTYSKVSNHWSSRIILDMPCKLTYMTSISPGTYFNCIMFMVASSVVTTIMILNYHHRLADTHEMPNWVKLQLLFQGYTY